MNDCEMLNLDARMRTFKHWPFKDDCSCTPEKMAESGFYFCGGDNEPDLVRCYYCRKELVRIIVNSFIICWIISIILPSVLHCYYNVCRMAGTPRTTLGRSMQVTPGVNVPTSIWGKNRQS